MRNIVCSHCMQPIRRKDEFFLGYNLKWFLGKGGEGTFFFFIPNTPYHEDCYMDATDSIGQIAGNKNIGKAGLLRRSGRAMLVTNPMFTPVGYFNFWTFFLLIFGYFAMITVTRTPVDQSALTVCLIIVSICFIVKLATYIRYEGHLV